MSANQNPIGPPKRPPRRWETSDYWKDAGEKIVSTFLFAFAGVVTADGFEWSSGKLWKAAAVAAGLSTVKALVGAQRKDSTTPTGIL